MKVIITITIIISIIIICVMINTNTLVTNKTIINTTNDDNLKRLRKCLNFGGQHRHYHDASTMISHYNTLIDITQQYRNITSHTIGNIKGRWIENEFISTFISYDLHQFNGIIITIIIIIIIITIIFIINIIIIIIIIIRCDAFIHTMVRLLPSLS